MASSTPVDREKGSGTCAQPFRIGHGTDRHQLIAHGPLILGGVHIESSPFGPVAHSDGDVVLHALIDALLGSLALGDIGEHFPPNNPAYKNANSANLLAHVLPMLTQHGYAIGNVDITIDLQAPKLNAYKLAMRERIATLLNVALNQVSLKAKTAEGLGPVGNHRAIDASATVLLIRHS